VVVTSIISFNAGSKSMVACAGASGRRHAVHAFVQISPSSTLSPDSTHQVRFDVVYGHLYPQPKCSEISLGERRRMSDSPSGSVLGRRKFVLTAAGTVTGAGFAGLPWPSTIDAVVSSSPRRVSPAPSPIPGGLELAPGVVIHVFPPGDPAVTLPFTGITLQGFDVEPSTITDFNGSTALAYHVGRVRASDGRTYNLETDIRAFEGEYVADGAVRRGSFALI
jgi:hypothetical protein